MGNGTRLAVTGGSSSSQRASVSTRAPDREAREPESEKSIPGYLANSFSGKRRIDHSLLLVLLSGPDHRHRRDPLDRYRGCSGITHAPASLP